MNNWKSRLASKLKELDVLFEEDCTYTEAITAWQEFFNHLYWDGLQKDVITGESSSVRKTYTYTDTEEFIGRFISSI